MAEIKVGIEGEAAEAAAEALVNIPGVTGSYEELQQKETVGAAIATIIGIVGSAVALAEQIRKWYQEWQDKPSNKEFHVVIYDPETGNRVLLKNASVEKITEILKSLSK
ncbi:MAG TPA: hypothetical protein VK203_11685 [Nostocaceae cyanobacterium]|nr:hypothetical protein [Nostocaceae cyanobacterium]